MYNVSFHKLIYTKLFMITFSFHFPQQSSPYCMRRESPENLYGNTQFEGYAIDLIYEISKILGFNYTIRLAPDNRYGGYNKATGWVTDTKTKISSSLSRLNCFLFVISCKAIICIQININLSALNKMSHRNQWKKQEKKHNINK